MCGIFGINKKETQKSIDKIISYNNHRGPDKAITIKTITLL